MDDLFFFLSGVAIGVNFKDAIINTCIRAIDTAINAYVDYGFPILNKEKSNPSVTHLTVNEKYREYSVNGQVFYRISKPALADVARIADLPVEDMFVPVKYIRYNGLIDEATVIPIIRSAAGYNGDFHGQVPTLAELSDVFGIDLKGTSKIIVVNDYEQEFIIR